MDIVNLILTLIIAILGGYLASKKKVPAAYMLGALFLVAIFNVLFNRAFFPTYFKFITQIATGTFIGSKFRSEDIKMLKKVIIPGMTMVVLMITFSFILSYLMSTFLGIDNLTSFFATAPGGIMDISLIAYDFKANTSQVALLQLIRLISVIAFVPFFTKKCYDRNNKKNVSFEQEIKKVQDGTKRIGWQSGKVFSAGSSLQCCALFASLPRFHFAPISRRLTDLMCRRRINR